MRPQPGNLIGGKYRIVRLIGDGGMGTVFEASHEVLKTPVALKFLHPEMSKRPGLVARFMREAQVSARIQSPHVTRVTDVEQGPDGSVYIVMELLAGESLQQTLDRQIKLPQNQAIDFALQILSGLEAAHALGIVHRDLKPDNVFITPSTGGPIVKLLDFGIAKVRESNEYKKGLTRPGAIMGTPEYMAPEQAYAADQVDHRADIYSIGAITYEMLGGERPAYGDDARAIVDQVTAGKVKRLTEIDPSLPVALSDVVHRAMDPVHHRRFASAGDMRHALAPFASELSHAGRLAATPAPAPTPPAPPATVDDDARPSSPVDRTLPPGGEVDGPARTASDRPATGPGGTALADPVGMPAGTPPGSPPDEAPKGATQQAPGETLHAYAAGASAPHADPRPAPGATPGYGPPGQYGLYVAPPVARERSSGRIWAAILALVLGVGITGGGIALFADRGDSSAEPETLLLSDPPPQTTLTPQAPDTPTDPDPPVGDPSPPVGPGPLPRPGPGPPRQPARDAGKRRDAGGKGSDAGAPSPIPPGIPLPPSIASAIPPGIPTTIPTFIPLPPGFGTPPPAGSGR